MKFTYWADTRKIVNTEDHALISKDVPRKYGHMLAAAPDLLEAAEDALKLLRSIAMTENSPTVAKLRDAILKTNPAFTIPSQSGSNLES